MSIYGGIQAEQYLLKALIHTHTQTKQKKREKCEDAKFYPQEATFDNGCRNFSAKSPSDWSFMTNLQIRD